MFDRKGVAQFLLALAAAIASVWAAMISLPLGVLVVSGCVACSAYLLLVLPRQKAFFGKAAKVAPRDRRYVALGIATFVGALALGVTIAGWIHFPREMTQLEHLEPRYSRCRGLVTRTVSSEQELEAYRTAARELIVGGREWIRLNMPQVVLDRYDDVSNVLPFSQDSDFNEDHRTWRNTVTKYCENLQEIMDNYAE